MHYRGMESYSIKSGSSIEGFRSRILDIRPISCIMSGAIRIKGRPEGVWERLCPLAIVDDWRKSLH